MPNVVAVNADNLNLQENSGCSRIPITISPYLISHAHVGAYAEHLGNFEIFELRKTRDFAPALRAQLPRSRETLLLR